MVSRNVRNILRDAGNFENTENIWGASQKLKEFKERNDSLKKKELIQNQFLFSKGVISKDYEISGETGEKLDNW